MRDRLIELIEKAVVESEFMYPADVDPVCIADHLLANGVIVPPCNVGDIVYAKYSETNEIEYYVIGEVIHLGSDNFEFMAYLENEDGYIVDIIDFGVKEIGLTVFLTKEEAERELGKRCKENACDD